jgi:hypothetical protein
MIIYLVTDGGTNEAGLFVPEKPFQPFLVLSGTAKVGIHKYLNILRGNFLQTLFMWVLCAL